MIVKKRTDGVFTLHPSFDHQLIVRYNPIQILHSFILGSLLLLLLVIFVLLFQYILWRVKGRNGKQIREKKKRWRCKLSENNYPSEVRSLFFYNIESAYAKNRYVITIVIPSSSIWWILCDYPSNRSAHDIQSVENDAYFRVQACITKFCKLTWLILLKTRLLEAEEFFLHRIWILWVGNR